MKMFDLYRQSTLIPPVHGAGSTLVTIKLRFKLKKEKLMRYINYTYLPYLVILHIIFK